jgi:hypothetical protein
MVNADVACPSSHHNAAQLRPVMFTLASCRFLDTTCVPGCTGERLKKTRTPSAIAPVCEMENMNASSELDSSTTLSVMLKSTFVTGAVRLSKNATLPEELI